MPDRVGSRWSVLAYAAFLSVLAWFLYFHNASAAGLVGPDETRYAQVSREMLRTHDWITPYLHGEPWFEKPPLFYWLTALAFRVFGVNEAAARLPAALFATGFLVVFAMQVRRWFPGETVWYCIPILLSSVGWVAFGRVATMEMLFSSLLAAALAFLGLFLWHGRRRWVLGFYGMLALSVLAKGFGGIILSGLILVAYSLATREYRWLLRILNPWGLTFFAVIAVPWHAAMLYVHGNAFFREYIVRQHFRRFVSNELAHPGPWWFYLPILLVGLFPWTPHLGLLRFRGLMQDHRRLFLLIWAAVVVLFFSASGGKLTGYILCALPALSLWIAEEWKRATVQRMRVVGMIQAMLLLALVPVLRAVPTALAHGLMRANLHIGPASYWLSLRPATWLAAILTLGWCAWRARRFASTLLAAFLMTVAMAWLLGAVAPEIDRTASARPIAVDACSKQFGIAKVERHMRYSLEFYCDRPMIETDKLEYTLSPEAPPDATPVREYRDARLTLWRRR